MHLLFRKNVLTILYCILFVVFCFLVYKFYFAHQFKKTYETYATLSDEHVTAAFLPATNDNQIRQELNRMLADVLATELSTKDRFMRAERGLLLLGELEKQIDAIGDRGEAVSQALEELEARATGSDRNDIVELALERQRIIGDIRGLSYRASYHTAEIFNRVIADGGALTSAHVSELNSQIPLVEEQFDRRAGLYTELESVGGNIERMYTDLSLF